MYSRGQPRARRKDTLRTRLLLIAGKEFLLDALRIVTTFSLLAIISLKASTAGWIVESKAYLKITGWVKIRSTKSETEAPNRRK